MATPGLCVVCVSDVWFHGGGGSHIISGHLEQPAGTTYVRKEEEEEEEEKRIEVQDFTDRLMLTHLWVPFAALHTLKTYFMIRPAQLFVK